VTPFTCFRTSEIDSSPAEEIIAARGSTSFTFSGTRGIIWGGSLLVGEIVSATLEMRAWSRKPELGDAQN